MYWKFPERSKTWKNMNKMKNSKIDQENEELGGQDHDFDLFPHFMAVLTKKKS